VVHLIRAAMRFVNYKDRKRVAAALKPIYGAADAEAQHAPTLRGVRRPGLGGTSPTRPQRSAQ
jgi:putative transposase